MISSESQDPAEPTDRPTEVAPAEDSPAPQPPAEDVPAARAPAAVDTGKPSKTAGTTLARELANFLIEFSIALHKHAMYPAGHPALTPAADNVVDRLDELLSDRSQVSVGVAMDQLVIEGVATDPKNPVLADLARRLHRHQLGAISFSQGLTAQEIESLLAAVAADPDRSGEALGSAHAVGPDLGSHVQLYPVAYDRLSLVDQAIETDMAAAEGSSRFGLLWVGLAKVAMDDEGLDDEERRRRAEDPSLVAHAIKSHSASEAYDQVVVGYLLKIAEELKEAAGAEAAALRNRMRKLIAALDSGTLDRLLTMGGDLGQRQRFMLQAARGFEVDSVLRLVSTAGSTSGQTISDQMLRMLQKLAYHAEDVHGPRQRMAEAAVREQVTELVHGWGLADPNPDEYSYALQGMAGAAPRRAGVVERQHDAEPRRIIEMAIECDVTGRTVADAMQRLFQADEGGWLFSTLKDAGNERLLSTVRTAFASKEQLAELLARDPVDSAILDELLPLLGSDAVEPMLQALISSESASTRQMLLERLMAPGLQVGDAAMAHLGDSRWYVQRNMLAILGGLSELPENFDPSPYLHHADARVRREGVRILLQNPDTREKGIGHALTDLDEQVVAMALATAATYGCSRGTVPLIVSRATRGPSDLRVAAIRVLGATEDPAAVTALLTVTQPTRKLFRWKHPPKTPEYLAALCSLRRHDTDKRVKTVLTLAGRRRDSEIAAAVRDGRMPDG